MSRTDTATVTVTNPFAVALLLLCKVLRVLILLPFVVIGVFAASCIYIGSSIMTNRREDVLRRAVAAALRRYDNKPDANVEKPQQVHATPARVAWWVWALIVVVGGCMAGAVAMAAARVAT